MKKHIVGIVAILLFALGLCAYVFLWPDKTEEIIPDGSQIINTTVEYNGHRYRYNNNLTNILFLGIDNTDTLTINNVTGASGQSDAIFLVTLNNETGEASILAVNRNAMTDIDIYERSGRVARTERGQITLQYAYGTGGVHSAWATKKTLSEMLCDIPIDSYFVMNLDGIATINDALGGIDVTMPEDYTDIDPAFVSGTTVHLAGDLTERFVRSRDANVFNSASGRMERQIVYIRALLDELARHDASTMYSILEPYLDDIILTNMDADQIGQINNYDYLNCRVDRVPGEMVMGEVYEEYLIDENELKDYIFSTYFIQIS